MKKGSPWYKRDPIAFLDGVEGMGPELIGAYAYLIDLIYARDGLSPRDDGALAGRMGCSKRKVTGLIDELIRREKIFIRDGFMTCKHAENHASKRRARAEQAASAGRASGEKRSASNENSDLGERSVQNFDEQSKSKSKSKNPPISPQGETAGKDPSQKNRTRGTRLDPNWKLPKAWGEWAVAEGLDEINTRRQADVFRDHWLASPGQKGVKVDWEATWRNWVRRCLDTRTTPQPSAPRSSTPALDEFKRKQAEGQI